MAQLQPPLDIFQAMPMEVQQQAAMSGMGALTATYKPRFNNPLVIIILSLLAIGVDIALLVAVLNTGWVFSLFIVIPILVVFYASRGLASCNLRIFAFTNGFISARGRNLSVVLYDQIAYIFFISRRGRYGSVSYTLTVTRPDGVMLSFNSAIQYLGTFGATVQAEVVKRHVPVALDAFKRGNTLSFGPFNLNLQGIAIDQKMIPWSSVQPIILSRGYVIIKQIGQRSNFAKVLVTQVPNLQVFLRVVKYAQGNR